MQYEQHTSDKKIIHRSEV